MASSEASFRKIIEEETACKADGQSAQPAGIAASLRPFLWCLHFMKDFHLRYSRAWRRKTDAPLRYPHISGTMRRHRNIFPCRMWMILYRKFNFKNDLAKLRKMAAEGRNAYYKTSPLDHHLENLRKIYMEELHIEQTWQLRAGRKIFEGQSPEFSFSHYHII